MPKSTTSNRLKQIMSIRNLKQVDILKLSKPYCEQYKVKMGRNDISQYVSGKVEPRQNKLYVLAKGLNVSEAWLMGHDVPMERNFQYTFPDLIVTARSGTGNSTLMKSLSSQLLNIEENLEFYQMYDQLDTEDKAEVRGEVKQMLKSPKYSSPSISKDIADTLKISDSTRQKSKP